MICPIRPTQPLYVDISMDDDDASSASSSGDEDDASDVSSDAETAADHPLITEQPERRQPTTSTYYLLKGMPLAPGGPDFPSPKVYAAHIDVLAAILASRKRAWWVVVRGKAPGVYTTP